MRGMQRVDVPSARRRETQLTDLIYGLHPRFAGVERIHGWQREHLEGGDVLAKRIRGDPTFARQMQRVCEGGGVALYRRVRNAGP